MFHGGTTFRYDSRRYVPTSSVITVIRQLLTIQAIIERCYGKKIQRHGPSTKRWVSTLQSRYVPEHLAGVTTLQKHWVQ